ncbi:hypothetical protein BGZ83_002979 [Gryganskiella cystojenkinii]|nr:hypothetical protein BGZ83_002979 [Gryganskiella cystojenkinii]
MLSTPSSPTDDDTSNILDASDQQHEHPSIHPLLIPELVLAVGTHLSQVQALRAVLVCKTWYACLIPVLYQRVTLGRKKQSFSGTKRTQRPMLGVLQRYGGHVRTLLCPENYAALRLAAPYCCAIETLVLGSMTDEVLEILRRNKETVRRLQFRRSNTSPPSFTDSQRRHANLLFPPDGVLNLLDQMPQLHTLSICYLNIKTESQATVFFRICERLTALELSGEVRFPLLPQLAPTLWRVNPGLRSLTLIDCRLTPQQELALFEHCPNLVNFFRRDEGYIDYGPLTHLVEYWRANGSRIKAFGYASTTASDPELAQAITAIMAIHPSLERVEVRGTKFGLLSQQVILQEMSDRLRILDLVDCENVDPGMVNTIMCACSGLTKLSADKVKAEDVIESRWVCLELEELQVMFVAATANLSLFHVQCGVYDQLSKLRKLRLLSVSRAVQSSRSIQPSRSILQLNLDSGLARLAQLKELREIGFEQQNDMFSSFRVGIDEIKWMLKHWPKLEGIYGTFSSDPNRESFMRTFLERARPGIRVRSQLYYHKRNAWPDSMAIV